MRIEHSMKRLVLVYIVPTQNTSNADPAVSDIHSLRQRPQQLVTLLSLTVIHRLGNRVSLLTGKANFLALE